MLGGMAATIKTRKGVHKLTMDRWGDSTHKMSSYNNRYQPSTRDQRQIDRMKNETMVLYPTLQPNPVLPIRSPGFSGGRGVFPRVTGGLRGLNWRAEGLRAPPPGVVQPVFCQNVKSVLQLQQPSTDSREMLPPMSQEENSTQKFLPEGHTEEHLTTLHPPQYRGDSTSEDEAVQVTAAKGRYTDPTPTPIPRDELDKHGRTRRKWKRRRKSWVCDSPRRNTQDNPATAHCPVQPAGQSLTGGSG